MSDIMFLSNGEHTMESIRWVLVAGMGLILLSGPAAHGNEPDCNEPNVIFLLDVSGSMGPSSDPTGKYMAAVTAVSDIATGYTSDVRFGLMVFPDPDQAYCGMSASLSVAPDIGTAEDIKSYLLPGGVDFFGGPLVNFDTPIYQTLSKAGELDDLTVEDRRSYVLLITDGEQDCCTYGDYDDDPDCLPGTNNLDPVEIEENREDLVAVVSGLKDLGIPVWVVGFGSGVDTLTLNAMAVAAGTEVDPDCDPQEADPEMGKTCYAPADDINSLKSVMENVVLFVAEEVCDGLDNDCDGVTDEDFPVGGPCDGPDGDSCQDGLFFCDPGTALTCDEPDGPGVEETCNGEDDDCDGLTDEDLSVGLECDGEDEDECAEGEYVCGNTGLGLVCNESGLGHVEDCNGEDDDCDGVADDGAGMDCQTACGKGSRQCVNGVLQPCDAPAPAEFEVCGNGQDDDCNGLTDEDFVRTCENECGKGLIECVGGGLSACDAPLPEAEACDLVDNDCNGATDDGNLCGFGAACFCGGCQAVCGDWGDCTGGLACDDGFCLDDRCPAGYYCANQVCVEGVKPPPEETDPGSGGGCGCRSAGPVSALDGWIPGFILALLGLAVIRRSIRQSAL